jgi:hypothetical protein
MDKETLFISHATPEDNDFALWLASRLQLLGYEVWVDKNSMLGGEKFWEEIDQIIRNKAAKLLLVYSKNICQKDQDGNPILGKLRDGIYKEFSLAESIAKQYTLKDFIILLNIDGADYNLFIGADRLNQITFHENWATGFRQLEKKLKNSGIPKNSSNIDNNFWDWYKNQYVCKNGIISKKELYYSNWWPISQLPEFFYIYQFRSEKQAKEIYGQENRFPISKISNHLSSFEPDLLFEFGEEDNKFTVRPQNIFHIKISDIINGLNSDDFPTQRDAENHLKSLLRRVFHLIMKNRKMFWYEMANKRQTYFYTPANLDSWKVKFEFPFRPKRKRKTKNLIGTYRRSEYWHYAVSCKPILEPIMAFSLKNHLIFTSDGFDVWKDKEGNINKKKIQTHRRSKASISRFFNEEWRDMLLAFINGLKKDGRIEIRLSKNFVLEMPLITEFFWADFGYDDPYDRIRQGLLSEYEVDVEEGDEEDEFMEGSDD